jgi:hypothetical protein
MNPALREERAAVHQAIRNRILLIAAERGLPKSETKKAMGIEALQLDVLRLAAPRQSHMVDLRRR